MRYILFMVAALPLMAKQPERVRGHADRPTPWIIDQPAFDESSATDPERIARSYLEHSRARFGLGHEAVSLKLSRHRRSLMGHHFHYSQVLAGSAVEGAELIVSVDGKTGAIHRVTNTTWPVTQTTIPKQATVQLTPDDALDVAWLHLGVTGHLLRRPAAQRCYLAQGGNFTLIYRVTLALEAPFGFWSLAVDAITGEVLSVVDTGVYRHPKQPPRHQAMVSLVDRAEETTRFLHLRDRQNQKRIIRANGSALVFDPDPRTTLMNGDLGDDSEAAQFESAYLRRDLPDISLDGDSGVFSLSGPYCEIEDLVDPTLSPAESPDGNWDFTREDSGFHDAMAYFHIDQNQRYLQGLGYNQQRTIQNNPIRTDSNGIVGLIPDNSAYDPVSNTLVFGPGCVDDSEDADVLLHEYGHALQYDINANWTGGHTGPMGEGFADYWGAVYSLSTPNGPLFHPAWAYSWDGHGESTSPDAQAPIDACWSGFAEYPDDFCWCGRYLNAFHARYDPEGAYAIPHMEDFNSEWYWHAELWGTPLFQAALALYNQGHPLEEANRIVLEAQFGRGANLTIPILAEATVATAAALYPDGPHARVLANAFARHEIPVPQATYTYLNIHVTPSARDWSNEILIHNPNNVAAEMTLTVYESDTPDIGLSDYAARAPETVTLASGATLTYEPAGENQRWVSISSDQPLAGTGFLFRTQGALGEERAGIPMFEETDVGPTVVYPHIPADRAQFFSSAVLLNPNDAEVHLNYELFGSDGSPLDGLLSATAPAILAPRQKWVTFLAPAFGLAGMFDDESSESRVSYVKITGIDASGLVVMDLAGFQLFGYKSSGGHLASCGIKAISDTSASSDGFRAVRTWPVRISRTGSDFTSLSVLNLADEPVNLDVQLIFRDGRQPLGANLEIGANQKLLGLNTAQGFTFPLTANPAFQVAESDELQAMLVTSPAPLRIFEFAGDNAKSVLDGASTSGLTSHTVFTGARGTLEILRVGYPREPEEASLPGSMTDPRITTITYRQPGLQPVVETFTQKPGSLLSRPIPGNGETTVEITGSRFVATMIDLQEAAESLTIVNGPQVPYNPKHRN